MAEPRTFTVNRLVGLGLVMVLLGLLMGLSSTQKAKQDAAFTLMWDGCRTLFSGLLVAFPAVRALAEQKRNRGGR